MTIFFWGLCPPNTHPKIKEYGEKMILFRGARGKNMTPEENIYPWCLPYALILVSLDGYHHIGFVQNENLKQTCC